jgi:hypothetical protein
MELTRRTRDVHAEDLGGCKQGKGYVVNKRGDNSVQTLAARVLEIGGWI